MDTIKKIFQDSFFVIKNYFCECIAVTIFLASLFLLAILNCGLLISFFEINYVTDDKFLILLLVFAILILFTYIPCEFGVQRWFYKISKGDNIPLKGIFYYFKDIKTYFQCLSFRFKIWVMEIFVILISFTPSVLFYIALSRTQEIETMVDEIMFGGLILVIFLSLITGLICTIFINHRYFLVNYLYFEKEDMPFKEIVQKSKEVSRKRLQPILQLHILMFPIFILCLAIIPILVVVPFLYIATAMKANKAYRENL